jgi:hypothetical protein
MSSNPSPPEPPRRRWYGSTALAAVGVLALGAVWITAQQQTQRPIADWSVIGNSPPPSSQACADCHAEQCRSFADAPHLHTLKPATDSEMLAAFAGQEFLRAADGLRLAFEHRDGKLWCTSSAAPDPLPVDWIFGSGRHARTPVSVWENPDGQSELRELAVSWYPQAGLDTTLGFTEQMATRHCFGCHTTHLPIENGKILQQAIVPGVRCERCHPGTREHLAALDRGDVAIERWSDLSPRASINRCGECHRRADQLTAADLQADNPLIIRFAPVGLSQSPCFRQQSEVRSADGTLVRLDCVTCHDPHAPAVQNAEHYRQSCLACHGEQPHQAPVCRSQPMTSECLRCHMPTVEVQQHLHFTDHWIRIRTEPDESNE